MNTKKEKEDFTKHLQAIAKDISEGITITKDNLEDYASEYEIGDTVNGFDYLQDCLDIEYITTSDKQYKGARVLIAFGGPNIWINTQTEEIEGYWYGLNDKVAYFDDTMGINESLEELFNCQ